MKYKEISIPISELHLDSENPRLSQKGMSEKNIMQELFDKEKVVEVMDSICRRGYWPNESLLVVKEKGKNVVVEGNRRLCALKLLKRPSLFPERMKEVTGVIKAIENPHIEEEVSIVVMSREDAKRIILRRHTTNPVRKWGRGNQAKFYRDLIDDGESVDSIVDKYDEKRSDVESFLKLEQLHCLAERMPLDANTIAVVKDSKQFSLSTLERIAKMPQFDELLGINFDEDVRIKGSIPKSEFVKGYKKIVLDIANKVIDTRNLNTASQIKEYFSEISPLDRPDTSKKGRFTVDDFTSYSGAQKPALKKPGKKWERHSIIPEDVKCDLGVGFLKNHFNELYKMPFKSFPISATISFRCFLEKIIHQYLLDKEFQNELRDLEKLNNGIGLTVLIDWMLKNHEKCGVSKNALVVAKKCLSEGKYKILSIHMLNTLVHNPHAGVSASEVEDIRNHYTPLVKEILKRVK